VGRADANGFDVFLSAEDTVWVGASSPAFRIDYLVSCVDAASGDAPPTFSGSTRTSYFNGQPHSVPSHVDLPGGCSSPLVFTQSRTDSILCGNGSGPTICPNHLGTTSRDLHSYAYDVTESGFDAFLSSEDGVWVGAVSPAFGIDYLVACP
jgi:hypothetical protein